MLAGCSDKLAKQDTPKVHVSIFFWGGGWQGRMTSYVPPFLPPPLIFKTKFKIFSPYPPKNQIQDKCHPPHKRGKVKITVLQNSNGLLTLRVEQTFKYQVLVRHDNLFDQGEPFL